MGMARMTDIDALLEKVAKIQASDGGQEKRVGEIILAITNAPTVEVVRCKDCKHYEWDEFDGCYVCTRLSKYVKEDFWCAHGERKDNA